MRSQPSSSLQLVVRPCRETALFYHGLAHLELGRDAASLHHPGYLTTHGSPRLRQQAGRLARLYLGVPDRLWLQVFPLLLEAQSGSLIAALRVGHPSHPGSREAQVFGMALAEALAAEPQGDPADGPHEERNLERQAGALRLELAALLAGLSAPPLELRPVAALGDAGRAVQRGDVLVVATALGEAESADQRALFQILHEVSHWLLDDRVLPEAERSHPGARSTDLAAPGYAIHFQLEQAVLALDHHLIRQRRPGLGAAYLAWCARWVIPSGSPAELARLRALAGGAGQAAAWRSLARVASDDPALASQAALDDLLLVNPAGAAAIERLLRGGGG